MLREQRPEDDDQQDQDEQDRQDLAQFARLLSGLVGVDLGGNLAGQVSVQVAGQGAGRDRVPQPGGQPAGGAVGADVDAGQDLKLHGPTIAAHAEVLDPLHAGDPGQAGGQPFDRRRVRGGERAAAAGDDHGNRDLVRRLERCGQPLGLQAGAAGRQEAVVVALLHAAQRRKEQAGEDGRGQPGHHDDPAEADGEPSGGCEEVMHACLPGCQAATSS